MSAQGFKARVDPSLFRFTSAVPADLWIASMAAEPISATYLYTYAQALVGLEPTIDCVA